MSPEEILRYLKSVPLGAALRVKTVPDHRGESITFEGTIQSKYFFEGGKDNPRGQVSFYGGARMYAFYTPNYLSIKWMFSSEELAIIPSSGDVEEVARI